MLQLAVLIHSVTRHLVRSTDCGTHARAQELRLGHHVPAGAGHALLGIGATCKMNWVTFLAQVD